jgi:tRNA threonylcarbamoyladenosine biosynthesis protein TsaE
VEKVLVTHSAAETQALGVELGRSLTPGEVVAFYGDLGSGKTCMIQGICKALEVADYVTSPTFILINEYAGRLQGRDLPVYHFDLYRLGGPDELEELGAEEYFYGRGVCMVEWAERAGELLPEGCRQVRLEHGGGDERRVEISGRTVAQKGT